VQFSHTIISTSICKPKNAPRLIFRRNVCTNCKSAVLQKSSSEVLPWAFRTSILQRDAQSSTLQPTNHSPTCPRKSRNAPASSSAPTLVTYVFFPESQHNSQVSIWTYGLTHSLQKVTPHQPKQRISRGRGRLSKRTSFVREIVKEVAGYVVFWS